jgi:4-amino-4-deoxy-L-arabinose transferase-like glycosyltransferase
VPRALWVLLGFYLALALAYNFIFPPFEPTDEIDHFRYVRYLVENRRLPVFRLGELSESHQPPLYYALAAALAWPFPADALPQYQTQRVNPYRGFRYWEPGLDNKNLFLHGPWDAWPFRGVSLALHIARLASLVCGVATVLLTYQIARSLFEDGVALAVTGLVAFNPMFLAVTGSLQNDAGAAAAGAAILWLCLHFYRIGFTPRRVLVLGVAAGVGLLVKITVGFLLVPIALLIVVHQPLRRSLISLTVLALSVSVITGWWFLRNFLIYGDPTGTQLVVDTYGRRTIAEGIAVWPQALPYAWSTFWGRFGHGDVVLPDWIYLTLGVLALLALVGLGLRLFRREALHGWPLAFLGVAGLVEFAGLMIYLTVNQSGYNGRYTFPALPAYMLLMVCGLLGLVPRRAHRLFLYALPAAMGLFALWAFVGCLVPVYTPPPALAALPRDAIPLDATLGDVAVLKGYKLSTANAPPVADQVRPGDRVYVTLYWQPLNRTERPYSVFIHLFDGDDTVVTQRDTYPGLGRNPTNAWTPGRMFADDYLIVIPDTAFAPTMAHWNVGLWQADTGDRAFVLDSSGQPVAAEVSFGQLAIAPRPGPVPNPVDLNFGDVATGGAIAVQLTGYSLPTRVLKPGQPFDLILHWQPAPASARLYLVFVHVTDAGQNLWANAAFEVRGSEQTVQAILSPDTPPGVYNLVFGVFYDDAAHNQARLKILAADGHEVGDEVRLTGVRVVAP